MLSWLASTKDNWICGLNVIDSVVGIDELMIVLRTASVLAPEVS